MKQALNIVVVSFNTRQKTQACLHSITRYTDRPYHIFVVDNASTDGSPAMILQYQTQYPEIFTVSVLPANIGYSQAVETVMPHLVPHADVCFINSDVYVGPAWASRLQRHLYRQHKIAAVAPIARGIGGWQDILLYHDALCPDEYSEDAVATINEIVRDVPVKAITAKFLQGTMWMIKEEAWQSIGTFDPGCICGADDADWCLRARLQGRQLLVALDTFVWHDNHSSFPGLADQGTAWINQSWDYFNHKWAGQFDQLSWDDLMDNQQQTTYPYYRYEEFVDEY